MENGQAAFVTMKLKVFLFFDTVISFLHTDLRMKTICQPDILYRNDGDNVILIVQNRTKQMPSKRKMEKEISLCDNAKHKFFTHSRQNEIS